MGFDSQLVSEIDLNAEGKQVGYLRLPHSVHRSAYGFIPIPIASIKNGDGPKVLLMAGNHGDEFEGQVALSELIRNLNPEQVRGQILILPMANTPAARAGLRTSPIDQGNLNRSFPGDAAGSVTQMIAYHIEHHLLRGCEYLLDIHSGGSSLIYTPTVMMAYPEDPLEMDKRKQLLQSLGFPVQLFYPADTSGLYSSSAATRNGAIAITAEVAGGGMITPEALNLLRKGIRNYLRITGVADFDDSAAAPHNDFFEIKNDDYYCYAHCDGLFEPSVNLGDVVNEGDLAGIIHFPFSLNHDPSPVYFSHGGVVVCKRPPARVEHGDCLFHLASQIEI